MEKEKNILLIINSLLDKKLFYANKDSLVHKSIAEFNDLCEDFSHEKFLSFLEKQDNKQLILNEKQVKLLRQIYAFKGNNYGDALWDLGLTKNELLKDFKKLTSEDNILPFSLFTSVAIDKKFFQDIDIKDHFQVRKVLQPLSKFIYDLKNKNIFISDLNLEFIYQTRALGTGYYDRHKIFVKCDNLTSSTLQHEYFHAMDVELAKKLNITTNAPAQKNIIFSETVNDCEQLKGFNSFIANMDKNNSSPQETKENLSLYFKKHFSNQFNDLALTEIKELHLIEALENFIGFTQVNFAERDNLIKELQQHINYALGSEEKPERTFFSIFCDIKDLGSAHPYYSSNCEKLARIYQAQYHKEENIKMFPLGSEAKLITDLNNVIHAEFPHVLNLKNGLESKEQITANIFKMRKLAERCDIQPGLKSKI